MVMDMKRMSESGRSYHEIPKYAAQDDGNRDAEAH